MNNEAIIRQAVRNTINQVGCTGEPYVKWDFEQNRTDAEVFENRVLYHFRAIQTKLIEDALREKMILVDMNAVEESYEDGFQTGQNWKDSYRPGGPWYYNAGEHGSERSKAVAEQLRAEHDAWMQGFDDARAVA